MSQIYQFPGRCNQYHCRRETLQCSEECNRYVASPLAEFPNNVLREEHCLDELIVQLRYLWSYYFGIGPSVLRQSEPLTPRFSYMDTEIPDIPAADLTNQLGPNLAYNPNYNLSQGPMGPGLPTELGDILPF